jgi:hypothetical protein
VSGSPERLDIELVVPIRRRPGEDVSELAASLAAVAEVADVTVVDGSAAEIEPTLRALLPAVVRVIPPDGPMTRNGKVRSVMTGVVAARHDRVVLADDDVRHDRSTLERIALLLDSAAVVRPQNFPAPMPWHARWDTARTLINRAFGSDFPGTLGVRRSAVLDAGGYDGDVLFENLELIRTIVAAGGREVRADGVFVPRRPPTVAHFAGQRVRQAYDSSAQPIRLFAELALLPVILSSVRRPRRLVLVAATAILVAEVGRRRDGGRSVFPPTAALWAPCWIGERAVCAWLALVARAAGGVRYADGRLRRSATPLRVLRQRTRPAESEVLHVGT